MDTTIASIIVAGTIAISIILSNKKTIKQFFCKHIMEDISQKKIRETRDIVPGAIGESLYQYYQHYACYYKCIKCEKEIVKEYKFNLEDDEGK